ncbi:alpha/beta hydrolase [Mesorhizobium sp. NZP2077]|nr:alpha/beta hydrolase [Mesorhizobium sp. NZP2077]QKC83553.1 alpha/beta hydrolase [Mesorhizobium sp. NZP2077]QKD17071.1 alpha/beta hydrolase [Mesorhizobium sp. NZP2077]
MTSQHAVVSIGNDVKLHFAAYGEGPRTAVLLHGFPQTGHEWRKVSPLLVEMGFRVIVPDYRGAGGSSKPAGGYDKWTMAGDIEALLREHLAVQQPIALVGHDIGAMVALAFAFRFREFVSHLVLIDAPLQGTSFMTAMRGDPRGWHVAFHQARDIAEHLVHGRERGYLHHIIGVRIFDPSAISGDDFDLYVDAYSTPGAMRAAFELYRAFDDDCCAIERARKQGKLEMPLLTLAGEAGGLAKWMPQMAREIAAQVDHRTSPKAAHWVPEEDPQFIAEAIATFVAAP